MDDRFYRDRARVLRELANEADPLIKKRLLRLANNYDDMTTTRGQRAERPGQSSNIDSLDGNDDVYS
jgi:hypothetical protein